ncbi:MAG TPA: hypothetical protein DCO72_05300 [Ruminococcus sp.]|nr:hypothetical protein [Ruminococcus sp.]
MQLWEMLKASKNIPVSDPMAVLWGQRHKITNFSELSGAPPLTFNSVAGKMADYRIHGNTNGVGILDMTSKKYQIPVTVSNGTKSVTTCINIGDTPLDSGEYLSYQEQKIYKNVPVPITLADASAKFYGVNILIQNGTVSAYGTCKYNTVMTLYEGIVYLGANVNTVSIQTNHAFKLTKGMTYQFSGISVTQGYIGLLVGKSYASINNKQNPAKRILSGESFAVENDDIYCMPIFHEYLDEIYNLENAPYLAHVVPFPARFPQLVTLSGTNILSVGTTPQPEKIYLKYGTG